MVTKSSTQWLTCFPNILDVAVGTLYQINEIISGAVEFTISFVYNVVFPASNSAFKLIVFFENTTCRASSPMANFREMFSSSCGILLTFISELSVVDIVFPTCSSSLTTSLVNSNGHISFTLERMAKSSRAVNPWHGTFHWISPIFCDIR